VGRWWIGRVCVLVVGSWCEVDFEVDVDVGGGFLRVVKSVVVWLCGESVESGASRCSRF
jgi:hypothetical protein